MTLAQRARPLRRWRAPREAGSALIDPPLSRLGTVLQQNRLDSRQPTDTPLAAHAGSSSSAPLLTSGSLASWSARAKEELWSAALAYTRQYRDVSSQPPPGSPLLLAGHQPELVHPGVWFKNFVLSEAARAQQARAVNLLIDNDLVRRTAILVPHGSPDQPLVTSVAFDRRSTQVPYEHRAVEDFELFESFGRRVADTVATLIPGPLIRAYWPRVQQAYARTRNLGQALAQARHELEADAGLHSLELPLSEVCRLPAFHEFVAELLMQAPGLHEVYNGCLQAYRRERRLRSQSHPVPNLARDGEWWEVPFWVWTSTDPRRRRMFARTTASGWEFTDRGQLRHHVWANGATQAVDQLAALEQKGVRLRPRALTTTWFARVLASDLFLHGIGGGIYDQLTDAIMETAWNIRPPEFLVVSATLRLPVPRPDVSDADLRHVNWLLRELQYHPEKYVDASRPEVRPLLAAKQKWVEEQLPRGARRSRHVGITEANAAMQHFVEDLRKQWHQQREYLHTQLRHQSLLGSREFAFCLFPEKSLSAELLALFRKET